MKASMTALDQSDGVLIRSEQLVDSYMIQEHDLVCGERELAGS